MKAPSPEAPVSALSGGNQQKVVIARALLSEPAILVADEPTQGVDVGARAEIYRILREVSAGGVPVVVASSDAKELEGLCDRSSSCRAGTSSTTLDGDEVTEERDLTRRRVDRAPRRRRARQRRQATALDRRPPLPAAATTRPSVILALVMLAARRATSRARTPATSPPSTSQLVMTSCDRAGLHRPGPERSPCSPAASTSPSGRWPASSSSIGSFFVNDGKSAASMVLGLVADGRSAAVDRAGQRRLIRFAQVHAGGRDAGDLHRARRARLPAARRARAATSPRRRDADQRRGRAGPGRRSSSWSSWRVVMESLLRRRRWGLAAAGGRAPTRRPRAASA